MENYRIESALKVARSNATKTHSEGFRNTNRVFGNRLHRSDQGDVVLST